MFPDPRSRGNNKKLSKFVNGNAKSNSEYSQPSEM